MNEVPSPIRRRGVALGLVAAALAIGALPGARAAEGVLTILVGYAPGGGTDTTARLLAEAIAPTLGRTVIVDNKPGAGGRIAAMALKNAPKDGSVLMLAPSGLTSIQTLVYKNELKYDFANDFAPVAKVSSTDLAIAVSANLGIQDAKGLAAWLKANPDKANYGSPAAGGLPHFAGLLFARSQGLQPQHVAYKGGAPTAIAVIAGEVPMGVSAIDDFAELDAAGKLKIVGSMGARRSDVSPKIPTLVEQGVDVQAANWTAMWAPAGVPAAQIDKVADALRRALASDDVKRKLAAVSSSADYLPPADLMALQKAEWALWTPVIQASGFKPGQ